MTNEYGMTNSYAMTHSYVTCVIRHELVWIRND